MGKKLLLMLLSILAAALCALSLTACDNTHAHEYSETVVKPTCTENGYTLHTCDCGKSYRTDEVPMEPHDLQFIEEAKPKCDEEGHSAYYACTKCDKWFTDQSGNAEITDKESLLTAKIPHTLIYIDEMPALCAYKGHIGYYECSVCNAWFSDVNGSIEITDRQSVEIDFDEGKHLWGEWQTVKESTCTASGQEKRVCEYNSKHVQTRSTSTLPHDLRHVEEVKATCTRNGQREYYECSVCKKWFTDGNGKVAITDKQSLVIPSNGSEHSFGGWQTVKPATCTSKGLEKRFCIYNQEHTESREVPTLVHNTIHVEEVKATCTEKGNRDYYECTVCKKLYSDANAQNEITDKNSLITGLLPHVLTHIPEKPSTCTEKGQLEYYECSACEKWFTGADGKNEITDKNSLITGLLPHVLTHIPEKPSTCTEKGQLGYYECSACEKWFTGIDGQDEITDKNSVITDLLPHVLTLVNEKTSTCTEKGHVEYYECPACEKWFTGADGQNEITDKNSVITDLLPHEYLDGVCRVCNVLYSTEGLEYSEVFEDNKLIGYELSGIGTATDTDIIVAKEYAGLPVIGVAPSAFHKNTQITGVTLRSGILKIGKYAFDECTELKKIVIPEGVTSIGYHAFSGSGLTGNLVIPDSVTEFGDAAFSDCVGITELTLGSGVNRLSYNHDVNGYAMFVDCTGLTKVTLKGANATIIPSGAFFGCTSLREVIISAKITDLGNSAFADCENIKNVYYSGTIDQWANINFETDRSNPLYYAENFYVDNQLVTEAVISSAKVSDYAFCCYDKLTSVTLLDTVISIGGAAFGGCAGLTSVTLPEGLIVIDYSAFYNCGLLKDITIPESLTGIGNYAFGNCTALESISIPNGVTHIGRSAFENCTCLTFAKIGSGIENIEYDTFANCGKLERLILPDGLKIIGPRAFLGTALKEIKIPDGVTDLGSRAFAECKELVGITLPNSIMSIAENVFAGTAYYNDPNNWEGNVLYMGNHLIKVKDLSGNYQIKEGTLSIAGNAFIDCTNLTGVTIPESVRALGDSAFSHCTWLTEITLPSALKFIGRYAFCGCTGLTEITIPTGVTSIGECAFIGCTGLTEITIPTGVTRIENYTFWNCTALESVTIPDSVIYIGYNAFGKCTSLKNIRLPDGLTYLAMSAFSWCTGLTGIAIPEGITTSINQSTFYGCTALKYVVIPKGVKKIDYGAFNGCENLEAVYFLGTEAEWPAIAIDAINSGLKTATVYYYSETEPSTSEDGTGYAGNYWHYDTDGKTPVIWKKQ